ncbi:hypothetical protein [Prevotella sp.]|uniref:hypothetical protein n=1 Tax=Prevotella sp. TaxID=59823 RepID=UPI003AB28279
MGLFNNFKEKALEQAQQLAAKAQDGLQNMQQASSNDSLSRNEEQYTSHFTPSPSSISQTQCSTDQLYDPRLEQLINAALADGVLTEKEKQILFKKAESFGVDLDEFEMILDARLYERQHVNTQQHVTASKSNKYGEIKKCPNCGAIVDAFQTCCPECGHSFQNVAANSSITVLFQKLDELTANSSGWKQIWYGNQNPELKRKISLITTFPVPTTKDDILEFLSTGVPLAKAPGFLAPYDQKAIAKAWRDKCQQIIIKARFSMKDDPKTLAEVEGYSKLLK